MILSRTEAAGRAGAIAAGLGAGASLATLGIETDRGKTLTALLADEPEMLSIFGPLFAFTTYIAIRPLLSRPPGKIEQWIMSALTSVVLLGATLLLIAWATDKGDRFDQRWYYWIIVPWPLIAGIALGRATLATTWVSWSHKVAAVAFLMAPLSVLVVCQTSQFGKPPDVVPSLSPSPPTSSRWPSTSSGPERTSQRHRARAVRPSFSDRVWFLATTNA